MNYFNITKCDMCNGLGVRVVLWVAGCSHHCKNCQNPTTWDEKSGQPFDENAKIEIYNELSKSYVSGITFSGGDPLYCNNRNQIRELIFDIKKIFPNKNIWLYTGFVWEEIKDLDFIQYIDVLVDGEYVDSQRDITLKWVGSSNQRVIDVKNSIKNNKIILFTK